MIKIGDKIRIRIYEHGAPEGTIVTVTDITEYDYVYEWEGKDGWLAGKEDDIVERVD